MTRDHITNEKLHLIFTLALHQLKKERDQMMTSQARVLKLIPSFF